MAVHEAATRTSRMEYWLLAVAVLVSASMLALPPLIPVGLGLLCWASILLASKRPRRTGVLVAVIAVVTLALVGVAALGIATIKTTSPTTPEVTLIKE
ncbi:hypothetical protein ABCS02_28745 [Microbacterium sp. X-17]|uniref:hypothetical protein n=1 Tax=Microbacterium sp. X-17 TaxID=3144404 RepID=UPI0031F5AEFD